MANQTLRPVAIVGGLRIPFCRSGSAYADISNLKMLSTVLNGLVDRYDLKDEQLGEVNAGAVISHSKDWNLAREAVLSTKLSARTPALTMQQACQIDSAIAAGSDTVSDVPIAFSKKFSSRLVKLGKARDLKSKLSLFKGFSPKELKPNPPSVNEPRTLLSMGQHCELMAQQWGITREDQDELAVASHLNAAAAYQRGFYDDLLIPCEGVVRDNNMRPDTSVETLAGLRKAYERWRSRCFAGQ